MAGFCILCAVFAVSSLAVGMPFSDVGQQEGVEQREAPRMEREGSLRAMRMRRKTSGGVDSARFKSYMDLHRLEEAAEMVSIHQLRRPEMIVEYCACLALYVCLGVIYYRLACGWSFINSFYFIAICLTTVGYGDVLPQSSSCRGSKLFTGFYALVGVFLLGIALGIVQNKLADSSAEIAKQANEKAEELAKQANKTAEEIAKRANKTAEKVAKRTSKITGTVSPSAAPASALPASSPASASACDASTQSSAELKMSNTQDEYSNLVRGIVRSFMITAFILLFGTVAFHLLEDLSFSNAFYLSCITASTVGFGDFSPQTPKGRLFCIAYVLVGAATIANVLQSIASVPVARHQHALERKVLNQFGNTLDKKELVALTHQGAHPNVCTKSEFTLGMLVKLNKLQRSDINDCVALFDKFDLTGDGLLSEADIVNDDDAEIGGGRRESRPEAAVLAGGIRSSGRHSEKVAPEELGLEHASRLRKRSASVTAFDVHSACVGRYTIGSTEIVTCCRGGALFRIVMTCLSALRYKEFHSAERLLVLAFRSANERGKDKQLASHDACAQAELKLEDTINTLAASVAELKHAARSKRAIQTDDDDGNATATVANDDDAVQPLSSPCET